MMARPAATKVWKTATTHPNELIVPVTVAYTATVATTAKAVTFAATTARRTERSSRKRNIQSNIAIPRMTPPNCRTRSELSASSRPPKSEIAESGTTTNRGTQACERGGGAPESAFASHHVSVRTAISVRFRDESGVRHPENRESQLPYLGEVILTI